MYLRFVMRSIQRWGPNFILPKLANLSWLLTTTFSGIGCLELAAKSALWFY